MIIPNNPIVAAGPLGHDGMLVTTKVLPATTEHLDVARRARAPQREAQSIDQFGPYPTFRPQTIYCGDNIHKLEQIPNESIDLIYIDPPFNSNRNYEVFWGDAKEKRAFEDRFGEVEDYIKWMRPRIMQLQRVLKPTGSFYYHCDWHASHYIKRMLDRIFGIASFRNEIVWKRSSAHSDAKQGSKHYGRLHDVLLFYTGGSKDYTWNQIYTPLSRTYIESHYTQIDKRGRRFQWTDLTGPGGAAKGNPFYEVLGVKGYWRYSQQKMAELIAEGRVAIPPKGKVPRYKRYLDESKGLPLQSVWDDLPPVNSQAKEAQKYPTQKPLGLLERIIRASSNPDDVVLDAFCGCGTALVAAQQLDRQWIGIDISPTACRVMANRLKEACKLREGSDFFVRDLPKTPEELRKYPPFEFQNWAVNALNTVLVNGYAIPNKAKVRDMGIDGRVYPIDVAGPKGKERDLFGPIDDCLPVQVKQVDKAGRPDIDIFETAMRRKGHDKGFFISFGFTSDAMKEIERVRRLPDGMEIIPLTVEEIIAEERTFRV